MNRFFSGSNKLLAIGIIIVLVIALGLTLFILRQQQNLQQEAAGDPDLVVPLFQLTDAGGNVRSTFNPGEEIYVRITIKNQGGSRGESLDGSTRSQIYANSPDPVSINTASDIGVVMTNGEFGTGAENTYNSIYGGQGEFAFTENRSWTAWGTGDFTARIFVNFNGNVSESSLDNNQATFSYTVTDTPIYKSGTTQSSQPSGFNTFVCDSRTVNSVTACVVSGPVNGNAYARITNNGSTTRKVGAAAYQAYYDYPDPYPTCLPSECPREYDWIWTQTIYSAQTTNLAPGATTYITLPVPSCNWQIDAFLGDTLLSYKPPNQFYSGLGTYIDGWLEQYNGIEECKPFQPTPTPTPTVSAPPSPTLSLTPTLTPSLTPTGTLSPSPTPSNTPTPTNTPIPTPTPTVTITVTPTPTVCPVPEGVLNVRIECPFCDL